MASAERATRIPPIPLETVRAARAALASDDRVAPLLALGDALGDILAGVEVGDLACKGDPGAPHVLAVATVLQCIEGLPDVAAVETLRARAAWRYALRLGAHDPLPDAAALRAFRVRLLEDTNAARAFGSLLARLGVSQAGRDLAPLPADTAALVDAVQTLNLLALALRTMRVAGRALLGSGSPDARGVFPAAWRDRYLGAQWPSLPRDLAARESFALAVAADGFVLIDAVVQAFGGNEGGPPREVAALRRTWEWLFERNGPYVAWRGRRNPPGGEPSPSGLVAPRRAGPRVGAPVVAAGGRRSREQLRSGP
jgi:hypothetical protein